MNRDRFDYVCLEAEGGRDAFVRHPSTNEEGAVVGCSLTAEHVFTQTAGGERRCWDYNECEEISRNSKEWPRR